MADYRKLEVWIAAKKLAVKVYRLTNGLPSNERFILASQIQRSAVSIVANIAEGAGRGTDLDFARFVRIAMGSLSELSALLDLALDLGLFLGEDLPTADIQDLQVRLTNLLHKLERDERKYPRGDLSIRSVSAIVSHVSHVRKREHSTVSYR